MSLAVGTRLGPYEIVALLGAGGMGEVYRAHDARLGRDVAIKVLSPHLAATPEVRARFEREARTISQLNHPHICTLHDIGRAPGGHPPEAGRGSDGVDYLVMELLEGETLTHRLVKGPLPVAEALTLGTQLAAALDRAHRAGVVHRDLKPGNVMLTKTGAKLMDFGLARAAGVAATPSALSQSPTVSRPLTAEGTIVGTFQYMAPEQLEGKEADARTDLWALGCVLYEMATGQRAFEGASQASLIAAIMTGEPRRMTELRPVTPPGLERVVQRCLKKDSDARFQSASDLAFALEGAGESSSSGALRPVEAAPERRGSRALAAVVTIAVVVALLVVGAGLTRERWLPRPRLREVQLTDQSWEIPLNNAALSPDGSMLLSDDWRGLHLTDPVTKETHDISLPEPLRGQGIAYSWRADSRSFVVAPALPEVARAGLWEISVLSGKASQMRTTGGVPRVSPNGQNVAFVDKVAFGSVGPLWVMDAAGGARKLADVTNFLEMGWSPDCRCLAVVEGRVPSLTIFDVQRGTGSRVLKDERLSARWGGSPGIAWLDQRRLLVSMRDSAGSAAMNLYELRLDASRTRVVGHRRRLTDWRDAWVGAFTLTSDHRRLALVKGWSQMDIYSSDLGPDGARLGDPRRLTLDNGDKVPVGWTPTSNGIVFYKEDDPRTYRQFLDSPTAELVDERHTVLRTRWDGGSWLYALRVPRAQAGATRSLQLVRAPVSGGAAEVLKEWKPTAHADSVGWEVNFDLPPIAGIPGVVWEWRDSVLVISRLDPGAGATNEIMRLDSSPARFPGTVSPDGGRLALTSGSGSIDLVDLRERRVSQLRPRPTGAGIAADSLVAQSVVWTPRGDALLVGTYAPGGLWRVELDGRAVRLYASRDFTNPWVGMHHLSPDGRKIALARITTQINAWVIEGLK